MPGVEVEYVYATPEAWKPGLSPLEEKADVFVKTFGHYSIAPENTE